MKSESGMVDDKTSEDAPNRFDKQSVSYGCDPEIKQMIPGPDFNHPVKCCSYRGKLDKSLLAEDLHPKVKGIRCVICGGEMHNMFTCEFLERCPFDKKVGEDFEVVCRCSRMHCPEFCSYPIGRVKFKHPSSCLKY